LADANPSIAKSSGHNALKIKETDRIAALHQELKKIEVYFALEPVVNDGGEEQYEVQGKAKWNAIPQFETYEDHRMAMAFAPLAMQHSLFIEEPQVVIKSYPEFWDDLQQIGFEVVIPQD
jgi:3-phosphoshikimate 1-carboxyvinyltransferase